MNTIYKAFPGGKHKVLTLSYDDGKLEDKKLVEIFNKYGIKGTFNINSGQFHMDNRLNKDEIRELYKGHEVAVHTYTHPTLARCSSAQIVKEILDDRIELEKIVRYPVRGIAYPNGSVNDTCVEIAKNLGIRYGRVTNDKYAAVCCAETYANSASAPMLLGDETGFDMPEDFMRWVPTCHHNHNIIDFGRKFLALNKKQYLYMFYVWGHSFEFEKNNNWNIIEDFCELMGNKDDIWYATNIEIVDYEDVFNNLIFAADNSFVYNPSASSAWVTVNNNRIVEIKGGETVFFN